jgi:cytochrome c
VLEYGTQWFKQNPDSRLARIDFNGGNRVPKVSFTASKSAGAIPLSVNFSANGSKDPDGDAVTYELDINGQVMKSDNGEFSFTFDKPGIYRPKLTVTDNKGAKSITDVSVVAGNEPPVIDIDVEGGDQFTLDGTMKYKITITDKEDGSSAEGKISAERVLVTLDFHEEGYDMTKIAQGHQRFELPGKLLMAESDCKSCHMIDERSAGPGLREVALRYSKEVKALELLSDKIIKGGSGVWGEVAMAAHPQLSKDHAVKMVEYILSLAKEQKASSLPLEGKVTFTKPPKDDLTATSAFVLTATYEDMGANGMPSLSTTKQFVFKASENK